MIEPDSTEAPFTAKPLIDVESVSDAPEVIVSAPRLTTPAYLRFKVPDAPIETVPPEEPPHALAEPAAKIPAEIVVLPL